MNATIFYVISLLEDLDPRAAVPSLRVVPIPTLREFAGAFEDVEELAEEGLFPSTESSSSKFLSAKKKKSIVNLSGIFKEHANVMANTLPALLKHELHLIRQFPSQQLLHDGNPVIQG